MSWEDEDHLDEQWLPAWSSDDKVTPEEPQAPKPEDDVPPEPPPLDCRINRAYWWLATLSDGPPPCGDWVNWDELDIIETEWVKPTDLGPVWGSWPCLPENTGEWSVDQFRESDGQDLDDHV